MNRPDPSSAAPKGVGTPQTGRTRPPPRPPRSYAQEARDFLWRLYRKAGEDNIFFLSGAIAFNVLVAVLPLMLAAISIAGLVLTSRSADPAGTLLRYINEVLPGALNLDDLRNGLESLIGQSGGLLSLSSLFFVWLATRLVGTLRTALREIFDTRENRGIISGKIFDIQMVLAAGTLLAINVALTVVINFLASRGIEVLGLEPARFEAWTRIYLTVVGVFSIWFMFALMYRYLPPRRIPWRTAFTSASFTAILFELMKRGFGIYATSIADYRTVFGNFATGIVLFLWIYYGSLVFVLGGEVGQVAAQRRARKRQKEFLG